MRSSQTLGFHKAFTPRRPIFTQVVFRQSVLSLVTCSGYLKAPDTHILSLPLSY